MSLHLFSLCLPLLSAPETVPSSSNSSNTTQTLVPAERGTIGNQTTILSPSVIFLAPVTSQAYPEHLLSSNNLPRNDSLLSIINPARDSNSSSIRTTPTLSRDLRRRRRNERRSRGGESCRQQSKLGIRAQCKQSVSRVLLVCLGLIGLPTWEREKGELTPRMGVWELDSAGHCKYTPWALKPRYTRR